MSSLHITDICAQTEVHDDDDDDNNNVSQHRKIYLRDNDLPHLNIVNQRSSTTARNTTSPIARDKLRRLRATHLHLCQYHQQILWECDASRNRPALKPFKGIISESQFNYLTSPNSFFQTNGREDRITNRISIETLSSRIKGIEHDLVAEGSSFKRRTRTSTSQKKAFCTKRDLRTKR